jgi:hypothetical protein
MSVEKLLGEDDSAFERRLLGAGRADALPHEETQAALLRFAASMAALHSAASGVAAGDARASGVNGSPWSRFATTAKWVVLGIVAGGMATYAWLQRAATPSASGVPVVTVAAPSAPPVANASTPARHATQVEEPSTVPPATQRAHAPGSSAAGLVATKPGRDLAAEVTALDGIRAALAIGALRDAERRLADYRRSFTRGALRSEAEVLALEVLVAQGRTQAAARAAERFLSEHPRDPQVARVRALAE